MKLLLTSAGCTVPAITREAERLTGKSARRINVAVINEGYAVDVGHRWVVDELGRAEAAFGGEFDMVNLLALDKTAYMDRLGAADLIYVLGGYTDYLMSVFNRTGLSARLPELLDSRVYLGSSAGSMIAGRRVSTAAYQELYGEGDDYGVTRYLEMADFAFKPHLNSPLWNKNRPEVLRSVTQGFGGLVYGVPDEAAVVVEDGQVSIVGGGVVKLPASQ